MQNDEILKRVLARAKPDFSNCTYGVGVDWTRDASEHRYFIINLKTEEIVYSWVTSHGKNSGPLEKLERFSNMPNSLCSSKGLFKTDEPYNSVKFGYALRLDGLEPGINDKVRARSIVMHPSDYVSREYMQNHKFPGRSWGCITLDPDHHVDIINMLKGGSPIVNIDS